MSRRVDGGYLRVEVGGDSSELPQTEADVVSTPFIENKDMVQNSMGDRVYLPKTLTANFGGIVRDSGLLGHSQSPAITSTFVPESVRDYFWFGHSYEEGEKLGQGEFIKRQNRHEVGNVGVALERYDMRESGGAVYNVGQSPFLPHKTVYVDKESDGNSLKATEHFSKTAERGLWPQWFWPASIAWDFLTRVTMGTLFFGSAIAILIVLLSSSTFDNRVRITSNFVTNGNQPTPANGLSHRLGNLPYGWIVFAVFMLVGAWHYIFTGLFTLFGALIFGVRTMESWFGVRAVNIFHFTIVENVFKRFDPSKFIISMFGSCVLWTLVLAILGVSDIIFLVLFYLALVIFSHSFEFVHALNFRNWAKFASYATPANVSQHSGTRKVMSGDLDVSVESAFGPHREQDPDGTWYTESWAPSVAVRNKLAMYPQLVWKSIAFTFSTARQLQGFNPALSAENDELLEQAFVPPTVDVDHQLSNRFRDVLAEDGTARVDPKYYWSKVYMIDDVEYNVNHGHSMITGWAAYAGVMITLISFYFAPMHTTSWYVWDSWQHALFWLTSLTITMKAIFNSVHWWDQSTRKRGRMQALLGWMEHWITPMHHFLYGAIALSIGWVMVAVPNDTVIN